MGQYAFLAALAAVFLEFASIIWVGERLGALATVGLLILAGMAGVSVLKAAGAGFLDSIRRPPRDMHFASREAASRFLMLIAGLLLMWPGFLSDAAALTLLFPPIRSIIAGRMAKNVKVETAQWESQRPSSPVIIEGEAVEIEVEDREPRQLP